MTVQCACGLPLEVPLETDSGVCLPCQLGSVPTHPSAKTADTYVYTYVPDPEDVHLGSGPFCASCEMPVVANDPECFWCAGREAVNA